MIRCLGAMLVVVGVAGAAGLGCSTEVVELEQRPDGSLARDNCTIVLESEWYRELTCPHSDKGDYTYKEKLGCSALLDGGVNCKSCWWGKRTEEPCTSCWSSNKEITSSTCHQKLP